MGVLCVLPARIASRRISRKPLQLLAGRPLIAWSWEAATRVSTFDAVWVATDSLEVAEAVHAFGGEVRMSTAEHRSGTDRVAEVAREPEAGGYEVIVNFQADEPFVDLETVERAVGLVRGEGAPIATLAAPITSFDEWRRPSVVKVVTATDGMALYFSRAPIPHPSEGDPAFGTGGPFLRHIGVYAFERDALERWTQLEASPLERTEGLEQLRAVEGRLPIRVQVGPATEPGVDVPEDLSRAERILAERSTESERHD